MIKTWKGEPGTDGRKKKDEKKDTKKKKEKKVVGVGHDSYVNPSRVPAAGRT